MAGASDGVVSRRLRRVVLGDAMKRAQVQRFGLNRGVWRAGTFGK